MPQLDQIAELHGHSERVWHAAWTMDGKMLASCSGDKTIRIWAVGRTENRWECVAVLEDAQERTIRSCEWSPSGQFLASVSFDSTVVVWEKQGEAYEVVASLEGHESEVKSVSWSPSGSYIATCSRDKSVWIWEADPDNDFECVSVLHGHTQDVKFVKWHPTKELLFSASYDDTVRVWEEDQDDWVCTEVLHGHESTVWGLATDPSGDRIATVSDDKSLIIWKFHSDSQDVRSDGSPMRWKQEATLSGYHRRTIFSVDWSYQNDLIVTSGADDAICVYHKTDQAVEAVAQQSNAHSSDINCVRWNPVMQDSCLLLVSAADDAIVRLWKLDLSK